MDPDPSWFGWDFEFCALSLCFDVLAFRWRILPSSLGFRLGDAENYIYGDSTSSPVMNPSNRMRCQVPWSGQAPRVVVSATRECKLLLYLGDTEVMGFYGSKVG